MTSVSIFAAAISVVALLLAWRRVTTDRLLVLIVLLLMHVAISVFYMKYSLTNYADSSFYYDDPYRFGDGPWGLSTIFVVKFVHILKVEFGATYLDCFLIFQAIGFAGLMLLVRVFFEIQARVMVKEPHGYLAFLFLPSMNFWTAAIGKDAPLFFAIALCVWSVLSLRRRVIYFGLSLLLMVLFRAHIALMAAIALGIAALFESSIPLGRKVALLTVVTLGLLVLAGAVRSTFSVDVTSVSSITNFLDKHNDIYATVEGNTSIGRQSFALRVVSLLFRPFFFDASGTMGFIASLENMGALLAFIYMMVHWRYIRYLSRQVFFVRFVLLYATILLLSLSLVYYNVGLGLRQRMMAYPMIFSVLVALFATRSMRTAAAVSDDRLIGHGGQKPMSPEQIGVLDHKSTA